MPPSAPAHPFSTPSDELAMVSDFSKSHNLNELSHICDELRVLRAEHLILHQRVRRLQKQLEEVSNPQFSYQRELDLIVNGAPNATPVT
jgi:ABC-type Na+ transport system ATPase subunit NatA